MTTSFVWLWRKMRTTSLTFFTFKPPIWISCLQFPTRLGPIYDCQLKIDLCLEHEVCMKRMRVKSEKCKIFFNFSLKLLKLFIHDYQDLSMYHFSLPLLVSWLLEILKKCSILYVTRVLKKVFRKRKPFTWNNFYVRGHSQYTRRGR